MTVVVTVFLVGMCGVYLWHLWAGVLSRGKLAAGDRLRLITLVLEAALMLFLARILIAWTPLTSWAWVAGFTAIGAAAALAVWRARDLPWVTDSSPSRLRRRQVLAPAYAAILAALTGLAYASLV